MCGILGFVLRPDAAPLDLSLVEKARDLMAHRGPDDAGLEALEDGRVVLAHRRLSIQDLSKAGHQPMRRGPCWIVYNGEVYNFADHRTGGEFRSSTDTEVVLSLYERKGLDFLRDLRGMFAFGLWDGARRRLVLARDRVGKKPLYYSHTKRGLAFASSPAPLISSGWVEPRLRREMLPEYLALGRVGAPDTLLEGVHKLPPGHVLVLDEGHEPRVLCYWRPVFEESGAPRDLAERLRESVALRLISDVPVGVTLSGGVDSSLVAALVAENGSVPLRTFTVGFDGEEDLNEAVHARRVANHLGAQHHEVWLRPEDVAEGLREVEPHVDEPNPNLIWLATWFVCRLAKEKGVTVLLTGDGGDELFFGYNRWIALRHAYERWLRPVEVMPRPLRSLVAGTARGLVRDPAVRELFRRAGSGEPVFWGPMLSYPGDLAHLLDADGRDTLRRYPPATRYRRWMEREPTSGFMQWVRRVGLQGHLVEDFLSRLDRMGMAVSVEGRAPLLDQEVVEMACAWPVDDLVRDGRGKAPLRDLVGTFYPREIIDRPKQGFCAPTLNWLRGEAFAVARDAIEDLDGMPLLNPAALQSLCATPPADRREASRLWGLVSLSRWWRRMRSLRPAVQTTRA